MRIINDLDMLHSHWDLIISKDSLRPSMTGVYFDLENQVMVGTNSHVLLVVPLTINWDKSEDDLLPKAREKILKLGSKIVPLEFFDKRKYMGDFKKYIFDLEYDFSHSEFAQVWMGKDVVFKCRYIDANFVNWQAVWPSGTVEPTFEIGLSFNLFHDVYKAIPFNDKSLNLSFYGKNRPIVFESKNAPNFKGLIMPTIG
jgi:DNA polymerase III sliding clamp (beta) subunit (PCNA family)